MIDAPLALAFTAGMLATVNPCGFAMLPAYLSFFLGADGDSGDGAQTRVGLSRALAVGLSVSAGFAATFALIGLIVSHLSDGVYEWSRWVTVVVGLVLVAVGVALLLGWEPKLALPRLDKGGRTRAARSMFLFGVSYGVASLSCTLPLFLPQIAFTFRDGNLLSGIAYFVAYGIGFAVLLTALTVALAVGHRSAIRHVRRILPWVQRVSGALLVLAGGYVAYYGWYEATRFGENDSIVNRVTGWSADVSSWVQRTGGTRVGLFLALVVAAAALGVAASRRRASSRAG
jgi:cytochrome c biogenesis protein CcdA